MIRTCILLSLCIFITGCSVTPPEKEIIYVYRVPEMPLELLTPVKVTIPTSKERYLLLSVIGKEEALTENIVNLYRQLTEANLKIRLIKQWYSIHKTKGEE